MVENKKSMAFKFLLILFWVIDILLIINCIGITLYANFTIGRIFLYIVTVVLTLILVFINPILEYTKTGFGFALKLLFLTGCTCLVLAVCFLLSYGYFNKTNFTEKTVIVLGAGLRGEQVSNVLKRRLDETIMYYNKSNSVNIVVTGGQGKDEAIQEALAMKRYLVQNGVNEKNIFLEDKSTSTYENLLFTKDVLNQNGIDFSQPVVIVTNNFHCFRAGLIANELGYQNVKSLPASLHFSSYVTCYLREIAAVLHTFVFGIDKK